MQPIVKTSIARQIAEQLRAAIIDGHFKSGERLPTEDEWYRGPAGGNFVTQPTHEELAESLSGAATLLVGLGSMSFDEIIEARRVLQGGCLRLAVNNADPAALDEIDTALARQRDPSLSDEAFCAADVAFHRALVDASGNGMLRFVMYTVIEALVPITNMVVSHLRDRGEILAFHGELAAALRAGDTQRVDTALCGLLDYLQARLAEARQRRQATAAEAASGE